MRVGKCAGLFGILAVSLFSGGCFGERPPSVPRVNGPDGGRPGDTLQFRAWGRDPDGDNLAYLCDWGDGAALVWSAQLPSGDTLFRFHVYADSGEFSVKVRCRDASGLESGWSNPFRTTIGFPGPVTPDRPEGPGQGIQDLFLQFSATAVHVRGDSVTLQFDWGDTLGTWGGFVESGGMASDSHAFAVPGTCTVRARARDREGNLSLWSEPETVVVVARPLEPPTGLTLSASGGINVRLDWEIGGNSDSVEYTVWFRPAGSGEFGPIRTVSESSLLHVPDGFTGDYTVATRAGDEQLFAAETVSTLPVFTDTTVLWELNAAGAGGYGWDTVTGEAGCYSMPDSATASAVDCYHTDFGPGWNGPGYFIASPHLGPDDPGGVVPPGAWSRSWLLGLWGNTKTLPECDSLLYEDRVDISTWERYLAVYTAGGYYALLKSVYPDPGEGTVRVISWFQKVRGLRLVMDE